jgi:hypothetical protein
MNFTPEEGSVSVLVSNNYSISFIKQAANAPVPRNINWEDERFASEFEVKIHRLRGYIRSSDSSTRCGCNETQRE